MEWSVKEVNNATETVFYVMNDKNIFGMVTGQNHIEGDIERARLRANQIVNNKNRGDE